jgi:hypothetical protein
LFSTEKAFDALPSVVLLYDKLDLDAYRKKIATKSKDKDDIDKEALGIDLFKYVLKNSSKIKEEVFEIVSIFEDKTVEEIKAQSFIKTIKTIKDIFTDKEATDFLKQAMQ